MWWCITQFTLPEQSDWCDNMPIRSYDYAQVLPVNMSRPYFSTRPQGAREKNLVSGDETNCMQPGGSKRPHPTTRWEQLLCYSMIHTSTWKLCYTHIIMPLGSYTYLEQYGWFAPHLNNSWGLEVNLPVGKEHHLECFTKPPVHGSHTPLYMQYRVSWCLYHLSCVHTCIVSQQIIAINIISCSIYWTYGTEGVET